MIHVGCPKVYWEGIKLWVQAQWITSSTMQEVPVPLNLTLYTHQLCTGEQNTENLKNEDRGEERRECVWGKTF